MWTFDFGLGKELQELFKWELVDGTSRNKEESGAESSVDYDGPANEVSEEKSISKWLRECSCILSNLWLVFAFVWKICLRVNWRAFGLMTLAEIISGQPSIDSVVWPLAVPLDEDL